MKTLLAACLLAASLSAGAAAQYREPALAGAADDYRLRASLHDRSAAEGYVFRPGPDDRGGQVYFAGAADAAHGPRRFGCFGRDGVEVACYDADGELIMDPGPHGRYDPACDCIRTDAPGPFPGWDRRPYAERFAEHRPPPPARYRSHDGRCGAAPCEPDLGHHGGYDRYDHRRGHDGYADRHDPCGYDPCRAPEPVYHDPCGYSGCAPAYHPAPACGPPPCGGYARAWYGEDARTWYWGETRRRVIARWVEGGYGCCYGSGGYGYGYGGVGYGAAYGGGYGRIDPGYLHYTTPYGQRGGHGFGHGSGFAHGSGFGHGGGSGGAGVSVRTSSSSSSRVGMHTSVSSRVSIGDGRTHPGRHGGRGGW